jgi:hypothetical protein
MRVYLSGGMEYADGEGLHWRRDMQAWIERHLAHDVFNPNVESDRFFALEHPGIDFRALKMHDVEEYRRIVRKLVEIDCSEIAERSDYVICFWDDGAMKGAGTKGELTMAHFFRKPVYFVTRMPTHEIPGWVLGCVTTFFPTFEELQAFLLAKFAPAVKRL